jgi:spore germination protein KB
VGVRAVSLKENGLNMLKENISLTQLFTIMINFLLGSAIVLGSGKEAKQDVWIAIGIATLIGIGLMYFYYSLNRLLPNKNLFEIMEYCFTRPVAIFISFGYSTYFFFLSCIILRDFAELISSAVLPVTPIEVIVLTFMVVIAYIVYLGLEVLGRVTEIFTPYLLGFIIILAIFLIGSGEIELHNVEPVLGDGLKPVVKTIFPSLISFPFGELVVFTVILSSVTEFKKCKKVSLISVLVAGGFLVLASLLMLFTLGADVMQNANFPLLSAAKRVSIGHFIERIDAIVVFIMMLGILVKSAVYLYGGLKGLEYVFKVPYRYFVFPISMIVAIFSTLASANFAKFLDWQVTLTHYLNPPIQLAIPSVIMAILIWKTKRNKNKVESQH